MESTKRRVRVWRICRRTGQGMGETNERDESVCRLDTGSSILANVASSPFEKNKDMYERNAQQQQQSKATRQRCELRAERKNRLTNT